MDSPESAAPQPGLTRYLLRNQTPLRICLGLETDPDRAVLQLPPYGEKTIPAADAELLRLEPWTKRRILAVKTVEGDVPFLGPLVGDALLFSVGLGVWALAAWGVWNWIGAAPASYWTVTGPIIAVLGLLWAVAESKVGWSKVFAGLRERVSAIIDSGTSLGGNVLSIGAVAAIVIGIPGAVILATGSWRADGVPAGAPLAAHLLPWLSAQWTGDPIHLAGRALQLMMIAVAASLPAALYFLFDRRKLAGLRQGFLRSVLVLDPDLGTIEDVESVYGSRMEDVLGSANRRGRRLPVRFTRQVMVPLTTLVLTIGWTLALDPAAPARAGAGLPVLAGYFVPAPDPLVFAFLGGYVFAITMLVRRYVRSDLKPEAMAHALVRILFAILVAWAFDALSTGQAPPAILAVAFMIGVVPQEWLTLMGQATRSFAVKYLKVDEAAPADSLNESFPLGALDGVNIYHRARLVDEGVDNLENLAHADLVDLLLETRLPLGTLVDWVDQSILILHTRSASGDPGHYEKLRSYGIRTATDLEHAWCNAGMRDPAEGAALLGILDEARGGPSRLRILLDALQDDQWMPQLRHARRSSQAGRVPLTEELLPHWDLGHERLSQVLDQRVQETTRDRRRAAPAPAEPRRDDVVGMLSIPDLMDAKRADAPPIDERQP